VLARVFKDAEEGGVEVLHQKLLELQPLRSPVRFEMDVESALWRLGAAFQKDLTMLVTLRVSLPSKYPTVPLVQPHGGYVEVLAPGELGRPGSKIVTEAARRKLSEDQKTTPAGSVAESLLSLVDWIENTELHELAAAACQPDRSDKSGPVRAFVRFHHILAITKRCYMGIWAQDLGLGALLAPGQPGLLLVEGLRGVVSAYIHLVTSVLHWGPTPARLVGSTPVAKGDGHSLPRGLKEVSDRFPSVVTPQGTYNQRDCTDFIMLAGSLTAAGHTAAGREMRLLVDSAGPASPFAHTKGRVKEGSDGWVGYSSPAPTLCEAAPLSEAELSAWTDPPSVVAPDAPMILVGGEDEDPELEEAIRLSLVANRTPNAGQGSNEDMEGSDVVCMEDDADLMEAIRLSLDGQEPPAASAEREVEAQNASQTCGAPLGTASGSCTLASPSDSARPVTSPEHGDCDEDEEMVPEDSSARQRGGARWQKDHGEKGGAQWQKGRGRGRWRRKGGYGT